MDRKAQAGRDLVFRKRGVLENSEGNIVGFWIRHRKGRKEPYLFEKAIRRKKSYHIEKKTISVGGKLYTDVPVKVYPQANSINHWGKYKR